MSGAVTGATQQPGSSGAADALRDEPFHPEVISETLAYRGRVWDVANETFAFGDGTITRQVIRHPGAVAVLAVDDEGRVLLIRQYRHPVRSREWEIPAGLLDVAGEDPLRAAQRELAEEVDLDARHWQVLADYRTSPGGSTEELRIYRASGVSVRAEAFARTEEEAEIVVRRVPLAEVVEAALAGRLGNSILLVAALAAHARG